MLNGGCILGTLRQMGEGSMIFLVVFLSFIPGMAFVVYVLNPLLQHGYNINNILLPNLIGIPAYYLTFALAIGAIVWFFTIKHKK